MSFTPQGYQTASTRFHASGSALEWAVANGAP
jgi:hypothetical protein